MKKITQRLNTIISIFLLIIATTTLSAQSGWENVLEDSEAFFTDIYFVEGSDGLWKTGWVIDYYGDIYKTVDGGDTWTTYSQTFSSMLSNMSFVDELIGYVCTYDGKVLKTTDGGVTWSQEISNPGDWYSSITFKDALNGVISGTPNMYTDDGGTTWQLASGGDSDESFGYAAYASGDTYYSTEIWSGSIARSEDNGASWDIIEVNAALLPNYIDCYGSQNIMTGGANETVYFSHDAGNTWTDEVTDDGNGDAICFAWYDADTVWAAGNDIYKSTDGGYTWIVDTIIGDGFHREIFTTQTNVVYVANDIIGTSNVIWRKIGFPPFSADFEASATTTCSGSTVDFTDLSVGPITAWSWTFEGGTPATSSDQNPTVSYSAPGVYDVELTVTSAFGTDTKTEIDYIEVLETPGQANTPVGETELCSGFDYIYSTDEVLYSQDYEWEITPSTAGDLIVSANEATLEVADDYTGDFSIQVRATNLCGNGNWSTALEGNISESPEEFELEGGGVFCEGGDGVEITLNGSQTGIVYELFKDDVTTGITVEGTGSEISFGMITEGGYYTAEGSNSNCMQIMSGQLFVEVESLPSQAATPTGPIAICDETSSEYESTGSEEADSYVWEISPETAGTISGNGLEATVNWNSEFQGIAMISIYGMNDCGEGETSDALEVNVGAALPVITGEEMVCDFSVENYEVENNEGSTYLWTVTGGEITEGQGTYTATVSWDGEGNGTIEVEEETASGCTGSSEVFEVMIDDCTGIGENNTDLNISVSPNPAKEFVIVKSQARIRTISLINSNSNLVAQMTAENNEIKVNTSMLSPGLYFIKVNTENGSLVKKLIIKQ